MNRIETRIIIAVTNALAEARESTAKTEMIEELGENLYQRFLELRENGMPEEEAYEKAMESLGDTQELLAFLREEDGEGSQEKDTGEKEKHNNRTYFSFDDLENGIEEIVNAAFCTAKVAADCARDVAKDVSEQIRDRYPDGVFTKFSGQRGRRVDCTSIPKENVNSLEIHLTNGNIIVDCTEETEDFIKVTGDTDEIETMLKDEGVLSICQGNTASAAYFFMRGMRSSDIEVRLPKKMWEQITISTSNGDIFLNEGTNCTELNVSTASGNITLEEISCEKMTLRSLSGDIRGQELNGRLYGETKSGDISMHGSFEKCRLSSASGDVNFEGKAQMLGCSSTSGDVKLQLGALPKKLKTNCLSGDCLVKVGLEEGFHLAYHTISGEFLTNMPLSGQLGETKGDAVFGEDVQGEMELSSVSGNIEVRAAE